MEKLEREIFGLLFFVVLGRRDRGREELGRGKREGNGRRSGGTRAGFKVWLEGVSCVCGRTSSFPAGERNQRLPGAGKVSMRRAGPRTPL